MVAACRRNGYWGLQFDVENINELDRDRFTKWFTDAAASLHAAGYAISIAVVHRTDDAAGPQRTIASCRRAGAADTISPPSAAPPTSSR